MSKKISNKGIQQYQLSYIICEKICELFNEESQEKNINLDKYFNEIFMLKNKQEGEKTINGIEENVKANYFLLIQLRKYFNSEQIKFLFLSNCVQKMILFRNSLNAGNRDFIFLRESFSQYYYFKLFCQIETGEIEIE